MIKISRKKTSNMFNPLKYKKAMDRRVPMIINFSADIIVDDIKRGITYGRDIDGRPMKPLKPATIKRKRKTGSTTPRIALSDEGIMKKTYVIQRAKPTKLEAIIRIPKKRSNPITDFPHGIGQLHHEGSSIQEQRKWFGISQTAISRIQRMFRLRLAKELRNNWRLR